MPDGDRQPYVEDAEDGEDTPIDGSKSRNSSAPPSVKEKEEANVSRTRNKDKLRKEGSLSPTKDLHDDSDSDIPVRPTQTKRESKRSRESKEKEKEREREREKLRGKRKSVTYEQPRPHTGRAKTAPNLAIQTASPASRRQPEHAPSPVITAAATAASRARPRAYTAQTAPRPVNMSYYGSPGSVPRPPLSNTRFHTGQPVLGTSFPGPQSPYPPHSPMYFPPTAPPYAGHYPPAHAFSPAQGFAHPPPPDYFNQQGPPRAQILRQEYRRPRSAMGHHPASLYDHRDHDEDLEDGGASVVRAPSIKKRPSIRQQEEERRLMPPPRIRRSSTTVAAHSPFAPPRQKGLSVSSIQSNDFLDDTDSIDDESQYSPSEQSRVTDWRPFAVRRPTAYDVESRYERGSPDRRQRRNSIYTAAGRAQSIERDYEDKFNHAQRYQEKLDGPTTQLTADTLRKITRTPSQRTKSTGSHGNDSYALTARNSIDTEDMRILVRGGATLTIGDASMAVRDGAEIRIPTNVGGGGSGDRTSRGGSNDSDTTYDDRRVVEDRRSRVDRPHTRVGGRTSSRPRSHVRGLPAPGSYYHPPPATEYSGHSGQYEYIQQNMYAPPSGYQYPGMR
ncbi:hypothetical protein N0V93_007126 [Gnomoniopsis smithogilvyi]|uniref:Uncharacterized protein n=1 Tax=Gnomoniopsis smithogilvyi TaxID=1191159 RepID=A0A9W8YQQ4_9PEZI|nr:hypothetical protein N0V93_007126 [Gnomoniopsis smithogilvyi]